MPADTKANGDIFGGWLMAQMDLGCSALARGRAQGRAVTVAVEAMPFLEPVRGRRRRVVHATMERKGRTFMTIASKSGRRVCRRGVGP